MFFDKILSIMFGENKSLLEIEYEKRIDSGYNEIQKYIIGIEMNGIFLKYFLKLNTISFFGKINSISDILNLFNNIPEMLSSFNKYINFSNSKNLIVNDRTIIRNLRNLLERQIEIIFDHKNTYGKDNSKVLELNDLLNIETLKIKNAQLNEISNICKNINNLQNELLFYENKILLKIQLANIYLFLLSTDHFKEETEILLEFSDPPTTEPI